MIPAIIAVTVLAILAIFQIALALGAPIGRYAWGGQHNVLPLSLRIGSVFSVFTYAFFAIVILSKVNLITIIPAGEFLNTAVWVIFTYLAIGIIMNAISRSKPERYTMTPTVIILVVCVFFVASA